MFKTVLQLSASLHAVTSHARGFSSFEKSEEKFGMSVKSSSFVQNCNSQKLHCFNLK